MKKKQELLFGGMNNAGQMLVNGNYEMMTMHSKIDPMPLNRKSKRALPKLIKKVLVYETKESKGIHGGREQDARKKKKAQSYLSKRLNNIIRWLRK